ncbi:hypothetical protein HDF24_25620 [Mucilaginibacter sp. X4EP1]|uniref:hypothetical protein n=1 Tax=Mucilaginibacter sp. X4EP1 TaxID=2723092 RepID=UPI0021699492|nr:hypothetical protein [Mucilaginibacter sp. X4EP1]MCS3816654.1 hypothetical protein [Mucilaginibacter sp. X4EP1]
MTIEGFSMGNDQNKKNNITQENQRTIEGNNDQINKGIPVTSLDTYLEMLKSRPIKHIDEEQHRNEQVSIRNKISSRIENEINNAFVEEMKAMEFISEIGYYSKDNPIDRDVWLSYFNDEFVVHEIGVYDEKNEIMGNYYYREKTSSNLTPEENSIKSEILAKYNALSEDKYMLVEQERNKQLEQKVRDGEMVSLGELTD